MTQIQNDKHPDDKLTFEGQRAGEEIIFILHRHPWFFFHSGAMVIGLIVLEALVIRFAGFSTLFTASFFVIAPVTAYIVITTWFRWANTLYVLTSDRVIAVYQKSIFHRTVSESPLDNIMTVNHEVNGPIRSILNFGDVAVRSSGASEDEIVFEDVFDPYSIQQKILKTEKAS